MILDFIAGVGAFVFAATLTILIFELSASVAPRNRRHLP